MFRRRPRRTDEVFVIPASPEPGYIRFLEDEPKPKAAAQAGPKPNPTPPPPAAAAPAKPKSKREWPLGIIAFATVVAGGLLLKGTGAHFGAGQVTQEEQIGRSFSVSADEPRLIVETFNGAIEIARGEVGRFDCLVTKRGTGPNEEAARADLKAIEVTIERENDTVRVIARRGPRLSPGAGAIVQVRVPEGADVDVTTANGEVKVREIEGPVTAHASNGAIFVEGASGRIALGTTNGAIDCDATDAVVRADTSNGSISFRGTLAEGNSSLETSNGRVTVRLPGSQTLHLDARTSNGKVESDFPIKEEDGSRSKHLIGDIARGDERPETSLKVRTSNGTIRIDEED